MRPLRLPAFPHRYQRSYSALPVYTYIQKTHIVVDKSLITRYPRFASHKDPLECEGKVAAWQPGSNLTRSDMGHTREKLILGP